MSRRCPECGGLLGAGEAICRACGHAVGPAAGATQARRPPLGGERTPGRGGVELGDPAPRVPSPSSLGDIPAATDADAFDLSAILDAPPAAGPASPQSTGPAGTGVPKRGSFVPAFTFPGEPLAATPAADLGNLDEASPEELLASAGGPQAPEAAAGDGWRVRNAAGTTYDMVSLESVIQWLQNKDSFDGIRIARGGGPFRTVEDFPEIMARLGMRSGSPGFNAADGPAPKLDLDLGGRKPQASRGPAAQRPESKGPSPRPPAVGGGAPAGARPAAARPTPPARTFGMGLTLALAVAAVVASLVGAQLAETSDFGLTAGVAAAPTVKSPENPPGPALQAALQAFDAQRYTAAEQLLQQAARSEKDDPRVFRYLALTLSKLGGRDREARAALAEYRRTRARSGGN